MELLTNVVNFANTYLWSTAMLVFIIGTSLYFSIRLRFTQIRNLKDMAHNMMSNHSSETGISTFSSFWVNMAARAGVGNIAGVATAIYMGGPGAVFWMWVTAIMISTLSFAECTLAQLYKVNVDGEYRGGGYYCGERGLGWKWYGYLFSITCIFVLLFTQPSVQSYMISEGLNHALGIPYWVSGVVGAVILFIIISGGIRRISGFSSIIVPLKIGILILLTVIVLIAHAKEIPSMFVLIFTSAFDQNAIFSGLLGAAIANGIRRAVFASGAGWGEEPPSAAAAEADHPVGQGLANSFGIYVDMVVCTCTALMILVTDCFNTASGYVGTGSSAMAGLAQSGQYGVVFPQEAVGTILPGLGEIIMGVILALFAFTTITSNFYQAETALAYLLGKSHEKLRKRLIMGMRFVIVICYFFFATTASDLVWGVADMGAAMMVWLNVAMLWFLFPKCVILLKDYEEQRKAGKKPFFNPDKLGIKNVDIWKEINKDKIAAEKAETEGNKV